MKPLEEMSREELNRKLKALAVWLACNDFCRKNPHATANAKWAYVRANWRRYDDAAVETLALMLCAETKKAGEAAASPAHP